MAIVDAPMLTPETIVREAIARLVADDSGASSESSQTAIEPELPISTGRERSSCALVVEQHRAIGVATERDLMAAVLRPDALDTLTLADVMSPVSLTWRKADINELADLRAIGQQMRQQGVTIVPVLDDRDRPLGIISEMSLLQALQPPEGEILHAGSIDPAEIATWRGHAARYRALFEDAHDAILIANLDGYITDVNYQAEVMFGYSRQELIGLHQSELHPPEDVEKTSASFQEVLREQINTATNLRILCKNKHIKCVDIRGKMIMVGDRPIIQSIFHEVTQEQKIEETLQILVKQTEDKQGDEFFVSLVQAIAQALSVDYVFLVELTGESMTTLAIYSQGKLQSNVAYGLENTPCECVLKRGSFICKSGVQQRFPNDQHLLAMAAESYVGIALLDQKGETLGNLFVINKQPMENIQSILSVLGIFSTRAAAELERQRANKQLEKLNQDLQKTLEKRTTELREREHFLHTLLDLEDFPISIFWKNKNSVYLGCNRALLHDANLKHFDEIIGKNDYEMPWAETEADKYRADDREVMESNQPKLGIIETQVQADGRQVWLETNKMPFHDLDGNVMGVLGLYQNITDRKQAESELQQISTRLNLAVQSAKIGIWEWNISTNVLIWDEQMFALYGIKNFKNILNNNAYEFWLSCLHPEDSERAHRSTQATLSGSADYDLEFRIVRPNGEIRFLHTNAIVQRDEQGRPLGMVGVNYDITDLKRTEQQLQQQLETIDAAVESIAILQNERYVSINPAHVKLFGYEHADELIGKSWKMLYEPDELARFEHDIFPVLIRDRVWEGETIARRKDGSTFIQGLSLTLSEDGALICMCRDITARKQAEADLRASETRWQFALEGVGDGIWDWDLQADEIFYSKQWKTLLGYREDEISSTLGEWDSRLHPDDRERCYAELDDYLTGKTPIYQSEYRIHCRDGSYKWVLDRGQVIEYDSDGKPRRIIGLHSDITERKQAEQQLRDAKEAAEFADRAKSNFLALMSHEIRTPINGVLGLAHLMQQTQLDGQQQEYLTNLRHSAQSLSQIVNDILDFSKIEADKLSLDTIKFELDEVIDRLKAVLALKASEKHLNLQFEIGETVPRWLIGDPLRLGQVAINLVGNAIKFTDRGSVTIRIEERDRTDTTTRLQFTVRDTGIGLTPAQIKILFEPFTQVDPSASRRQSGTGLGLTICQRLVELMGGTIQVQSEPGQGSTFCFELTLEYDETNDQDPYQDRSPKSLDLPDQGAYRKNTEYTYATNFSITPSKNELPNKTSSTNISSMTYPPTRSILHGASVLLVEDNDVNQLVARKVLEQLGMKVELAVNGRKAIAQVLHRRYDLILMDVRMPEMDGLEATRRIRRLSELGNVQTQYLKTVPIIAMTAHAFESDQQRSLQAGMNDHLSKPIDPETLRKTLTDWIRQSKDSEPAPSFPVSPPISLPRTTASIAPPTPTPSPVSPVVDSSSSPPMLPGLDVADGLARVYDDTQLYRDLLKLFAEIYQPFASDLHAAFQAGNYGQVIHLVHTLKGAAANVSAMTVVAQSDQVLQTLRTQTHSCPTIQFESDKIAGLLRSLDLTLSSIADAIDTIAVDPKSFT
jgi:PAS domain S-box-containing protein